MIICEYNKYEKKSNLFPQILPINSENFMVFINSMTIINIYYNNDPTFLKIHFITCMYRQLIAFNLVIFRFYFRSKFPKLNASKFG